jgi:hypothetical protein
MRQNKAVDRLMFIEVIKRLDKIGSLSEYTYYGLGGPYLEEFRLLYEFFPDIEMVSIEKNAEIVKRADFHMPCGKLRLEYADSRDFLIHYDPKDKKSIFWLDYTNLSMHTFEDFQTLLPKVTANSIIKLTLRAEPRDYKNEDDRISFRRKFEAFMPDSIVYPPVEFEKLAALLQEMLQIASQQILPAINELVFQPMASFYYTDGDGMFTLTGIVCERNQWDNIRNHFGDLPFSNFNWNKPKSIDLPYLSTKERLYLERHLPFNGDPGEGLLNILGYSIDEDRSKSIAKFRQYADFHRYFPYFIKAIP